MKTVFVAPQSQRVSRWQEAFPNLTLVESLGTQKASDALVWLHVATPGWAALLAELRANGGHVIVLSPTPDMAEAMQALRGGARGYGHAWSSPELLKQMATVVQNGGIWVGPELLDLFTQLAATTAVPKASAAECPLFAQLSEREGEVARLVKAGLSNKEMARQLNITERTVKAHMGVIFRKLSVRDRVQLVLKLNQSST